MANHFPEAKQVDLQLVRSLAMPVALQLNPLEHQITALPDDKDLEFYFIPHTEKVLFAPYLRKKPYRNLKLISYEHPATSLSFFFKHKYTLEKDVPLPEVVAYVENHIAMEEERLMQNPALNQSSSTTLPKLHALLNQLRQRPDSLNWCLSNYHLHYRYWYLTYRYFTDETGDKSDTRNTHLLKHEQRTPSRRQEKVNLIFVHSEGIHRDIPNDNKQIDRYLALFPNRIEEGTQWLYWRNNPLAVESGRSPVTHYQQMELFSNPEMKADSPKIET